MLILLFAVLCSAGVAFLFRELTISDRTTAEKLRNRLPEREA
jgi:hypothetical protein